MDKTTVTKWSAMAAICVSGAFALVAILAMVSLFFAQDVAMFGMVLGFLIFYILMIATQIVLGVFLYRKKEGKRFIIPLIVLFSFQLLVGIVYYITAIASAWDSFQFALSLATLVLLITALCLPKEKTNKEQ